MLGLNMKTCTKKILILFLLIHQLNVCMDQRVVPAVPGFDFIRNHAETVALVDQWSNLGPTIGEGDSRFFAKIAEARSRLHELKSDHETCVQPNDIHECFRCLSFLRLDIARTIKAEGSSSTP